MEKTFRHHIKLPIGQLQLNNGQLKGLGKNPRFIRDEKFEQLKQSLQDSPEFLDARPLLVYPISKDKYITIAGNMRLRAARELGFKSLPCYVFPSTTPTEKLREYTIKDNVAYGEIDFDILKEDWNAEELQDWGMDLPDDFLDNDSDKPSDSGDGEDGTKDKEDKDERAEALLDDAWKKTADECVKQYDKLEGFSFLTPHAAKIDFINFCYYGKEYPRNNSLAFHPMQMKTNGADYSLYEGLQGVVNGKFNVKGLRFVLQEKVRNLYTTTLPFGGVRMPADFPADLAKSLIDEFVPSDGGRVLDPCSGWGGRMVGFLASRATEYVGCDASPYQAKGDNLIFDTFKDATKKPKKASVSCSPFEKFKVELNSFDFALTSPPYFDTEKYLGGEQSRETSSNYEQWRNNFYSVLIKKVYDGLKKGCVFALQVGSQSYPLLEDGKKIASQVGFTVEEVRPTSMTNTFVGTEQMRGEVVIILRK